METQMEAHAGTTATWDDGAMAAYLEDGDRRARALPNRGPIRFEADGSLAADILAAYWEHGFYVFENVIDETELAELRADVEAMLERAPKAKDAETDIHGRPALGVDLTVPMFHWARPLGDPVGGTKANGGRHPVKMAEPDAPPDAPDHVIQIILGTLQILDTCLRAYGHPQLLAVAAAVNGDDFVPFNEALFIKQPGLGASVAWHQDGTTHWNSPELDAGTHGFNFMVQLYGSTAANGVWVLPGSHKAGKVDIAGLVRENGGSDRLPGAVPLVCGPGDAFICNRQAAHGSFANTSPDLRVTVNMGFHRRRSVLGVVTKNIHGHDVVYDEARVHERSRMIALGIDARQQRFPEEPRYVYRPMADDVDANRFDESTRAAVVHDYNKRDLHI